MRTSVSIGLLVFTFVLISTASADACGLRRIFCRGCHRYHCPCYHCAHSTAAGAAAGREASSRDFQGQIRAGSKADSSLVEAQRKLDSIMRELGGGGAGARSFPTEEAATDRDVATIVMMSQAVPLLFESIKQLKSEIDDLRSEGKPAPKTPANERLTEQEVTQLKLLLNRLVDTY